MLSRSRKLPCSSGRVNDEIPLIDARDLHVHDPTCKVSEASGPKVRLFGSLGGRNVVQYIESRPLKSNENPRTFDLAEISTIVLSTSECISK